MENAKINPDYVAEFEQFLRFPSISTDPAYRSDVQSCAEWLIKKLNLLGLETQCHPTAGHPIVVARSPQQSGLPTVLVYGHYDVQPVDPLDLWQHPPFEPHREGDRVFARGTTDNKGQILGHILGYQELVKNGAKPPVNVIFLIEGEEESGSAHLGEFVVAHRDELACDVILVSDTGMLAPELPTISYGLRGICAMEIFLEGPARDLHSGVFGGGVVNPAAVLVRLLSSLHHQDGSVAVSGFYDSVRSLSPSERETWQHLPVNDQTLKEATGAPELGGEPGYSAIERIWSRPTIEINGLTSGYQGPGNKTVLPAKASAKLTFRLVPDQNATEIIAAVESHLETLCPPTVKLQIKSGEGSSAYVGHPEDRFIQTARAVLKKQFNGTEPALVREGGSIPVLSELNKILGAEVVMVGWALPDANIHSPNENFPLANLEHGIRFHQEYLKALAKS